MKILVSIDHSDASSRVIDAIVQTLWPPQSQFKIVHVHSALEGLGTPSDISSPEWHKSLAAAQEQIRKSATELVQGFVDKLKQTFPDCQFTSHLCDIEDQPIDATILSIAGSWQPELMVLGSHGKRGISRLLLGSVSFSVLCQSRCSVRIIKEPMFPSADNTFNVLIPVDDKPYSEDALTSVRSRPWHPATRFRLLTVLPDPLSDGPIPVSGAAAIHELDKEEDVLKEASAVLRKRAESLAKALDGSYEVDSVAVRGDARDTIIEQAYTWPAGLIVMGSKGKTVLARFFLGSVSSAVTQVSPCSVEVVRPRTSSLPGKS
ncbi:MAG: universal stress protein [Candidatus Melainabacteria bacterium]|nr:universal stress protein [Candidatus Melainabacteria bacterium]